MAACGTPPPTHFHSLMPAEIGARSTAGAAAGIAVVLEPIRVPAQVDQPQWLVEAGDGSVALLEQGRWASPLRDEFRQALLEELIVGQGAIDARTQPAGVGSALRISVDVRRFDSLLGREARIEAWDKGWARIWEPVSLELADDDLSERVPARFASYVRVLEPMLREELPSDVRWSVAASGGSRRASRSAR